MIQNKPVPSTAIAAIVAAVLVAAIIVTAMFLLLSNTPY